MFVMVPRAAASAERIQAGPRDRGRRCATRTSRRTIADAARRGRVPRRRVPLPRRRGRRSCAASRFTAKPGQTTAIVGGTGSGKTTLDQPDPALLRRHLRQRPDRRRRRPADCARKTCGSSSASCPRRRSCSAARSRATSATATRRPTTRRSGRPSRSPRRKDFVTEMDGRAGGRDRPGRHERLGRPAPAPGDRPGDRQEAEGLHLRRQLLGPRLQDRPAAAGGAARARPATRR